MGGKHFSEKTIMEINELRTKGLKYREIGEQVGLNLKQIEKFFERQNRRQREIENGYIPKQKNRSHTASLSPQKRIRELEREVEILKAFLHAAGRR